MQTEAAALLGQLRGRMSERKLRLFGAACCRLVWPLLVDERSREAVRVAERLADEGVGEEERRRVVQAAEEVLRASSEGGESHLAAELEAAEAAAWAADQGNFVQPLLRAVEEAGDLLARHQARGSLLDVLRAGQRAREVNGAALVALLHELVGEPGRGPLPAEWRTPEVLEVGRGIYATGDFTALPVLADALEESGCTDVGLLGHCRVGGRHTLGCWALDAVLARS